MMSVKDNYAFELTTRNKVMIKSLQGHFFFTFMYFRPKPWFIFDSQNVLLNIIQNVSLQLLHRKHPSDTREALKMEYGQSRYTPEAPAQCLVGKSVGFVKLKWCGGSPRAH